MECRIEKCFNNVAKGRKKSRNIEEFYNKLCAKVSENFIHHYNVMFPHWGHSYGFAFAEQQAKIYVSHALFEVCNGCAMKEQPIQRVKSMINSRDNGGLGIGRLDYWASYNTTTVLMEMKHSYIKFNHKTNKFSRFWLLNKKNEEAKKQLDSVYKKLNLNAFGNLWSASFAIVPVFIKVQDGDEVAGCYDTIKTKQQELVDTLQQCGFNKLKIWHLDPEMQGPIEWSDFSGNSWREAYPLVCYGAHFKKLSRDK